MKFYTIIVILLFNSLSSQILHVHATENAGRNLTKELEKALKKQNINIDLENVQNTYTKEIKKIEKKFNLEKHQEKKADIPHETQTDNQNIVEKPYAATEHTNSAKDQNQNHTPKTTIMQQDTTTPTSEFEKNFKKVDIKEEYNPFDPKNNNAKQDIEEEKSKTVPIELNADIYNQQNTDIEQIDNNNKNDDLADKRKKILEEFKAKLEENKKKDAIIETINKEIIADEFAVIVDDTELINNNLIENETDKNLLNIAKSPITTTYNTTISEKEYKNTYLSRLKETINKRRKKQREKEKQLTTQAGKATNKNKQVDNKIEIEKVILKKKEKEKKEQEKINISKDPEIFNITDTGVTTEILSEKRFEKLFENRVELLRENIDKTEYFDLVVPTEKKLINFKTTDIPTEILTPYRSKENRHIPLVLKAIDFQDIVKNAVDNNDINVLRGVIELLKEPDYILDNGQTALNYASVTGATEILKYLLYSGANVNIQDYNGNTPLHNAILREDHKIIKLLVENNSNLDIFNIDGYTPLMLSIVNGKNDISAYLLKFEQNLIQQNYKKETILDLTNKFNRDIIRELILDKIKKTKIEKQ